MCLHIQIKMFNISARYKNMHSCKWNNKQTKGSNISLISWQPVNWNHSCTTEKMLSVFLSVSLSTYIPIFLYICLSISMLPVRCCTCDLDYISKYLFTTTYCICLCLILIPYSTFYVCTVYIVCTSMYINIYILLCVPYHVDQCTKNKHMFRILTHGLFLTCTDNLFFLKHTQVHVITACMVRVQV